VKPYKLLSGLSPEFSLSPIFAYDAAAMDAQRETGALLIAASIIAAIRLRGEPMKPSPKLTATIAESVQLARLVLRELQR
jgi:hypothetical protein